LIFEHMKKIALLLIAVILLAGIAYYFMSLPTSPGVKAGSKGDVNSAHQADVKLGLKGCDICGYNALEKKGAICGNCGEEISNKAVQAENLSSIEEYIIIKQIEHFMPDTLGSSIDFLNPSISPNGYPKNSNWRPKVYETQIYEIQKAMLEADQRQLDTTATTEPAS